MNIRFTFFAAAFALSSVVSVTNASAQEKTRAEVRQELIDAHAKDDCVGPAGFCNPYFGS